MKTKLLKSILSITLFAMTFAFQAQTTIYNVNPTGDGIISDAALVTTNPQTVGTPWDGTTVLKLGASDADFGGEVTNAVIPFQLPVRPMGKLVVAANLKVNLAYLRHWIDVDVDLYGLPYNASNTLSSGDFYDQGYADPSGTVTAIQSGYIVRDVASLGGTEPLGTEITLDRLVDSDSGGDAALVAYINAQYDAGAVAGDYVFLRLSINTTTGTTLAGAHFYGISDETTAEAPELTLEIEDADVGGTTADYTVTAPTEDGYMVDAAITTANPNPFLWNAMKLGSSDMDGNGNITSAIIPFALPARPSGEAVDFANLNVYVSFGRQWLNSNVDLYGLSFVADASTGREIFAADHFAGAYPDVTVGVTAIEDDYFTKNVALGNLDTPRWEETTNEANLIAYLEAQYDAGAVAGDWVFLRLSIDNTTMTGSQYFNIEGGDSATPAALEIGFTGPQIVLDVDSFDKQSLGLYPNPLTDGRLRVSLDGFSNNARLDIYSITGQLVHSEKIEASSRNSFETQLNLNAGLYIVKLQDGERGGTQKLIVQ